VRTCGKSAACRRRAKLEPLSRAFPRAFACSRLLYPLRLSAFLTVSLLGLLSENASGLPCSAYLTCNRFGLRLSSGRSRVPRLPPSTLRQPTCVPFWCGGIRPLSPGKTSRTLCRFTGVSPQPFSPGPCTECGSPCSGFRALHATDFMTYSRRRQGTRTPLRGDREEGFPGGIHLSRGVFRRRYAPFMSHVTPLLEAEDMALHFLPREALPGHLQGHALCFGTWPLTHGFTFQNTGPTSAYPGDYSWPLLLRASCSPAASGWRLLRRGTCSTEGCWRLLRSQFP